MFDEISTQGAEYEAPRSTEAPVSNAIKNIEQIVADVLNIEERQSANIQTRWAGTPTIAVRYTGKLRMESSAAFEMADKRLNTLGYHARFSEEDGKHTITVIQGLFHVTPRPWWVNAVLFTLTIFTTMWAGAQINGNIANVGDFLQGIPYALAVLLILGAHELGHYFAARYHKVAVTLPYFIPFPPLIGLFGTMGAFIQLREPMRNRKQLFDVGAAGPLAGLFFAVPILLIGVATAEVNTLPTKADCEANSNDCLYMLEGNSILYASAKYIFHGDWLPNSIEDMSVNQLSFAGWTGLFVTGLNLLPVGQLDGGHILYSLIGKIAKRIYYPALALMILLVINNQGWVLWVFLLLLFGRVHAEPLDDITPLDRKRQLIGIFALTVFVLVFVPSPITIIDLTT